MSWPYVALVALFASACADPEGVDGGRSDAATRDAGVDASPRPDAGEGDAGSPRDGGHDAGRDAGTLAWAALPGGFPARWGHVGAYDERRDRLLIATGDDGRAGRFDDVWAFPLPDGPWARLDTSGEGPAARVTATAVIDPDRDRLLLFGGERFDGASDEVFALDLETLRWSRLPAGPSPRFDAAAATDGRRAWVFAGFAPGYVPLADLWELDLARDTWRELPSPPPGPSPRTNLVFGHDGARDRLVAFGGHASTGDPPLWDTWAYGLAEARWRLVAVEGRPDAYAHVSSTEDPACEVLWTFGGDHDDRVDSDRLHALDLRAPEAFHPVGVAVAPPPRRHAVLLRDRRGDLYVVGGWQGADALDDAWRFSPGGCLF